MSVGIEQVTVEVFERFIDPTLSDLAVEVLSSSAARADSAR